MESLAARRRRARQIARRLAQLYPEATCALHYTNPLQLLIATILSAQCTDARVNQVTPALFARYPDAQAFAQADPRELERLIQPTGFYRNKARNIIACCRALVERYGGQVPPRREDLVTLPGVGRKTANVVLGTAFGKPALPVDTHVRRLSRRLGLTQESDPDKIEQDLMRLLPEEEWANFSHRLIWHGRLVCRARRPDCAHCGLADLCPKIGVSSHAASPPSPAKKKTSS